MNYTKIFIGVVILTILFFVIRYFIKKVKAEKVLEKEITNINNNTGGNNTVTNPPPVSNNNLVIGDTLIAKYDGVKIYDLEFNEFRTVNKNGYVGRLDGDYSHEAFYKISTPTTATGSLIVAKVSVKK